MPARGRRSRGNTQQATRVGSVSPFLAGGVRRASGYAGRVSTSGRAGLGDQALGANNRGSGGKGAPGTGLGSRGGAGGGTGGGVKEETKGPGGTAPPTAPPITRGPIGSFDPSPVTAPDRTSGGRFDPPSLPSLNPLPVSGGSARTAAAARLAGVASAANAVGGAIGAVKGALAGIGTATTRSPARSYALPNGGRLNIDPSTGRKRASSASPTRSATTTRSVASKPGTNAAGERTYRTAKGTVTVTASGRKRATSSKKVTAQTPSQKRRSSTTDTNKRRATSAASAKKQREQRGKSSQSASRTGRPPAHGARRQGKRPSTRRPTTKRTTTRRTTARRPSSVTRSGALR